MWWPLSSSSAGESDLWRRAVRARAAMVEALAERDEALMEAYLTAMEAEDGEEAQLGLEVGGSW